MNNLILALLLTVRPDSTMINALPHCSTGLASRNTSGTDRNQAVFLCAKNLSSSLLCRAGWAVARLAGACTGTPTCPVRLHDWRHGVGVYNLLQDITMNTSNPMGNHAQKTTTPPLFSIFLHRQCLRLGVSGKLAMRFKARYPACIVKFSGFEGGI